MLIGHTLVAAFTSLAMAFLIVLGPLILETARRHIPFFVESNENFLFFARYGITITAMIVALFVLHAWLPCGRRSFLQILPGIVFTMAASMISGIRFMQRRRQSARRHRLDQKEIGAGGARRRLVLAAAGYADDRNAAERRLKRANARDRLDAVDPRQHHVHQHRIECAERKPPGAA